VPSPHCEDLLYKKRCISTPHFEALNHFCGCSESKRQNVALITRITEWPFCPLGYPYPENRDQLVRVLNLITRCTFSKRERSLRNARKFALICTTPTGYPPRASKRHTARSWGHTRELADILSVSYVEAGAPRKCTFIYTHF
jgi:hypothetical protein